jgi:hypothetical protein
MMSNLVLLATCGNCPGTQALKDAANENGYGVTVEVAQKSDERTFKSALLGIGLPVLVREDGGMSDDGVEWRGVEKKIRTKVTHPVDKVVDIVDKPVEVVEDDDEDQPI